MFNIKQQKHLGRFDINFFYKIKEENPSSIDQISTMNLFTPEFWNELNLHWPVFWKELKYSQRIRAVDCRAFLNEDLLDNVFNPDFPSFPDLGTRLGMTINMLNCDPIWLSSWYLRRAAKTRKSTKLGAVGLLYYSLLTTMISATESILRTVADSSSMLATREHLKSSLYFQFFLLKIRYLLVHLCANKKADEIANFDWLRDAISAFLLLCKDDLTLSDFDAPATAYDLYLPDAILGKVKELAVNDDEWKAVLQLYQYKFAIPSAIGLTKQFDDFIYWYAQDLHDDSHTAAFEIISYLRYGETNKGLADIRTNDALKFLKDYPRLVPVLYRFVKHSGLMEERFWALFQEDETRKEQVKEEESALAWSKTDAPVEGPTAMFLPHILETIWQAIHFLSMPELIATKECYNAIANMVQECSRPSASKNLCDKAISDAKKIASQYDSVWQAIQGAFGGEMPHLQNWIDDKMMKE
jgi:hypothetical protein